MKPPVFKSAISISINETIIDGEKRLLYNEKELVECRRAANY
jgi:hypothetical protein